MASRELYALREALIDKKYGEGLDLGEARQLDWVTQRIHEAEDTELRPALDRLSGLLAIYERLSCEVRALGTEIGRLSRTGSKD